MRHLPAACLACLALALTAAAAPSPAPAPAPSHAAATGHKRNFSEAFLFTLTARKVTLERAAGDATGETGTLTLLDPSPHTIWFTDKPERAAGTIDNIWFLSPAFSADNGTGPWMGRPNAVLISGGPRAKPGQKQFPGDDDTALVVTLGDPRTKDNGDVAFNVTVVPASTELGPGLAANYLSAGRGKPAPGFMTALPRTKQTLETVALFIDDYYMEVPAASAPPPPPPPPPAPRPFNAAAWDQKYEDKMWARISGPQPVDSYSCSFMGGCGGWGAGGGWGVPSWG